MSEEKSIAVCCGFDTEAGFVLLQRQAQLLAASTLVTSQYQRNVANCAIAAEIAARLKMSPLMVMKELYTVNGNLSWSAKFLVSAVNLSGRYTTLQYEVQGGDDPFNKKYKVRAYATEKATGDKLVGEWIDWRMVDGEGWSEKKSSKWLTMPGQMFKYRAATFWARVYCPEITMGMLTTEEVQDVNSKEKDITPRAERERIQHTPQSSEDILSQLNQAQTAKPQKETFVFKAEAEALVEEVEAEEIEENNDYLRAKQGE